MLKEIRNRKVQVKIDKKVDLKETIKPKELFKAKKEAKPVELPKTPPKVDNNAKVKQKRRYGWIKSIFKAKKDKRKTDYESKEVLKVSKYDVKDSRQRDDLIKRYNRLYEKANRTISVNEQITLFMEYYQLYSDLAESSLDVKDKSEISNNLKGLYKKLKNYGN